MLWYKAFHVIFVVTWFSGLFYLPRLFVYHADTSDEISNARFQVMEGKLYYAITLPSAILATVFGVILLSYNLHGYLQLGWMHLKLSAVLLLWIYTLICGKYVSAFSKDKNVHSGKYYRFFNELPAILLVIIVILVVVKPTF
jgi:protoporphyrinogen IX oxidase